METLIIKIAEFGAVPAFLVVAFFLGVVIKKIETNGKADAERAASFQKELKTHIDKTDERFRDHAERMAAIEKDYLEKDRYFADAGGWKSELAFFRKEMTEEFREVRKELMKR